MKARFCVQGFVMFQNLSTGAKGALCMIIGGLLMTSQDGITFVLAMFIGLTRHSQTHAA